jgi:hypothetical protein
MTMPDVDARPVGLNWNAVAVPADASGKLRGGSPCPCIIETAIFAVILGV